MAEWMDERIVKATVADVRLADGDGFLTRSVGSLELTFDGVPNDRHAGALRPADARTPWHKRNTPIRNTRQLSLASPGDCAKIAAVLGIAHVDPAWLGTNVVIDGLDDFSALPPATRLQAPSGLTLFITEPNAPCRQVARVLQAQYPEVAGIETRFVPAAKRLRGLVALVERPGHIATGDELWVRIPPQALWR
jgi:MOSC domain-containing protein YiiM